MASNVYFLQLEVWHRLLSHNWAISGLREEAVETLSPRRCLSVNLVRYLDLLKFNVEKSFSHKYVLPKRHMVLLKIRESSGKLGVNYLKNGPSFSAFSLISLNLALSPDLHWRSSIWSPWGAYCTSTVKSSAKIWNVALCVLRSANLLLNSYSSFEMATAYSSPLNCVPASTSALHPGKWPRLVWESWAFHKISFVENEVTLPYAVLTSCPCS